LPKRKEIVLQDSNLGTAVLEICNGDLPPPPPVSGYENLAWSIADCGRLDAKMK
jgi:hypothetical protein